MSFRLTGAPQTKASPTGAARWLAIALIVWLAGAIAGFAMMPSRGSMPGAPGRKPAHRPVEIESPSTHDLPALALIEIAPRGSVSRV